MINWFIRSTSCAVKSYLCRAAKQPLQPDCFKSATANQIAQLQSDLSPVESNNVYSIVTWFVGTNLWNDRGDDKTAFQVDRADLNRANTLVRPTVLFDCLGGKKNRSADEFMLKRARADSRKKVRKRFPGQASEQEQGVDSGSDFDQLTSNPHASHCHPPPTNHF